MTFFGWEGDHRPRHRRRHRVVASQLGPLGRSRMTNEDCLREFGPAIAYMECRPGGK